MGQLSGGDIDVLSKLLVSTLDLESFKLCVYVATGDQVFEAYVAPDQPLLPAIRGTLIAFEKQGLTERFLAEIHVRRPNRPDVQTMIEKFFPNIGVVISAIQPESETSAAGPVPSLAVQRGGVLAAGEPSQAAAPGLQKNVRPYLTKVDVHVWLEKLSRIERLVCRIELAGNALGTGFLVGPAAVLTNWHVAEAAAGQANNLVCRFDYLRLSNGSRQPGLAAKLHADGCVDSSPYSAGEKAGTPDAPPPTPEELDYALLRLAEPPAAIDEIGTPRGFLNLPDTDTWPDVHAPLLIVQHPDGAPMKLALDTDAVIGANANRTRLRYHTNTEPGSSGSPCFSIDWDLVALHHYGDPAWQSAPLFNQGIPIGQIANRIRTRGYGSLLTG